MGSVPHHSWVVVTARELGLTIRGVLHIGGHWGQEVIPYEEAKILRQVWVEPVPENFAVLSGAIAKRPDVHAFQVACASVPGRRKFFISEWTQSQTSSLAQPKRQVELYPRMRQIGEIEVDAVRLDDLLEEHKIQAQDFNLMVVDTQGTELDALKGAEKAVSHMDCIVAEVGTIELYEGMALDDEVGAWLKERGFEPKASHWFGPPIDGRSAFGDIFYVKRGG